MTFLTLGRKLFVAFNAALIYLTYFTFRSVGRRFFPDYRNELKWSLIVLYGMTTFCYLVTSFRRPKKLAHPQVPDVANLGIVDPLFVKQLNKTCDKCHGSWQPPRSKHCHSCKTCVFRQDHHSEWVNNCIGLYNQKCFILLNFYGFLLALLTLIINITAFFIWTQQLKKPILEGGFRVTFTKLVVFTLVLLGLGLLLLCLNFLFGQYFSIRDNQTSSEQEDGDQNGRPADLQTNVDQVFGKWITWFPIPTFIKANYLELLYKKEYISITSQYIEDVFDINSGQFYKEYQKYRLT